MPAKKTISYHWGKDHLLIDLGNRVETRIRILFVAEWLLLSGMATIFLLHSLPLQAGWTHWISGLGALACYVLAAYRLLSRIFQREQLLLEPGGLMFIRQNLWMKRRAFYSWDSLGYLHYTGHDLKTDHPLKGSHFDYFGFDTHEHLVQRLHHEGNLFFEHARGQVRFARGVYLWHAEELVQMMKLFAGNALKLAPEWKFILQEPEV